MQPVAWMLGCPKGPGDRLFPRDYSCLASCCSQSRLQTGCGGCLWKAPGHGGLGPHWPSHNVHLHLLLNKERRSEALFKAKPVPLATRRSISSRSRDLLSLMQMNLKTWGLKSSPSQMALGSASSLIKAPLTRPCPFLSQGHQ